MITKPELANRLLKNSQYKNLYQEFNYNFSFLPLYKGKTLFYLHIINDFQKKVLGLLCELYLSCFTLILRYYIILEASKIIYGNINFCKFFSKKITPQVLN